MSMSAVLQPRQELPMGLGAAGAEGHAHGTLNQSSFSSVGDTAHRHVVTHINPRDAAAQQRRRHPGHSTAKLVSLWLKHTLMI